jgi:hypothetical protein
MSQQRATHDQFGHAYANPVTRPDVLGRIAEFNVVLAAYCNEKNINKALYTLVITPEVGKKFARIVRRESWNGGEPTNGSVHCFIDLSNGDILKAASFKVPAKGVRGNIFAEDFDIGIGRAVGEFGAAYLR